MATLNKPIDLSKFRKGITKSIDGLKASSGFNDPKTWLDTGSYGLNYLISGDFFKGVPLEGKFTQFAGDSGSGKSYLTSGNIVKDAQEKGVFVVLFDSENALDEQWLHNLGVDTSEDKLLKINISMIDDVAKFTSDFIAGYKSEYDTLPLSEKPKILFVIDSIGMLLTPTDVDQFQKGEMKGDMGRKAKQITAMCRNIVSLISSENIGLVVTNHTYLSQDQFSPDSVISGGSMLEYASSIIIALEKRKLKEDEDGNKTSEVHGIRSAVMVRKTRYNKPFEKIEIQIPYETGMNRYSGLFDFFERKGLLKKIGNRYQYIALDGTEILEFRKRFTDEIFDRIMTEFPNHPIIKKEKTAVEISEEDNE